MGGKLWEGVAGKLAERWLAQSVPALVFWLASFAAWIHSRGGWHATLRPAEDLEALPLLAQIVIVAALILGIGASALLVQRLTPAMTRLLEGHGPRWVNRVAQSPGRWGWWKPLGERTRRARERHGKLWLANRDGSLDANGKAELARLEAERLRYPDDPSKEMPTRLGNILRAVEERPRERYGLDTVALWPHLWLRLPSDARGDLAAARQDFDRAVGTMIWGFASLGLVGLTRWALLTAVLVPLVAYRFWVLPSAATYADLVGAAFDVYRGELYAATRWPQPEGPKNERAQGIALTAYLVRGVYDERVLFAERKG
ncbi:hypothetical protein HNP84_003544 [Thermocatellispora tengchongensis]|uniref:Uncharacterized protein n=1 Tax=Thermocatellispora tengchongensis TaxID=1073253 RepID=A0A840P2A6_9ACTN|nr:hypothetical protein [Thermocatellispora tengchongensis]MBB5133818.1 hypothetical protein [Thermocatellispora tengchongensis]